MAPRKLSLAAIRRAAATLPGIEEGTSYGTPAWRHRGRFLARLHQDGEAIVLGVGAERRDHLLAADPATFFLTDHYRGGAMVLARLDRLSASDLAKLLQRMGPVKKQRKKPAPVPSPSSREESRRPAPKRRIRSLPGNFQ